jgi:uncharacterized protein (DUF1501 family)
MSSRRTFLQQSALVSLAPLVPAFLQHSALAAEAKANDRILVVIQLDGGNDGLNTVIPFADPLYVKYRNELRIADKDIIKLNDSIGLHPQLKPAAELFQDGRLTIIQGVGYPNPNRSHFESMAIWHHAKVATQDHDGIGWLGRAGDSMGRKGDAASIHIGDETLPVALRGRRSASISVRDESDLKLATGLAPSAGAINDTANIAAFVGRSVADSFDAARRFADTNSADKAKGKFPTSKLGEKLRLVSRLIKLNGDARIYYVSQPGYDTHAAQQYTHLRLLDEFADALVALLDDLKAAKLDDRVVVLAFSEFGRRVAENASAGTDHGVAGPVFLAGSPIRGGIIGDHPRLDDLDEGDLKMQIDFREIYATILQRWFAIDSQSVLAQKFKMLDCLAPSA